MGTWDIGHFDNDTAADFSGSLDDAAEADRPGILRETLLRVARTEEYLDSDEAAEAVAAAALVAAQCPGGEPVTTAYGPDEPIPALPPELRGLAVSALDRTLREPSELLELWDESGSGPAWRADVLRLRDVLVAGGDAPGAGGESALG
ncbi:DUF4259 domain-containing protein [Streptomyces genisteinicus]|uniref:DUF4259 domain-containing protein n=1 Tax=Streptomyces genisteinicus TaxID=2768068 RepID=A0A7H0HS84_9ACTN|nr:DUF4259 domain-containing protein [Streptomyces genisteinicus]QNP63400.1 DUF4259 domain-containing protein [Streptomyces genisteinicus]